MSCSILDIPQGPEYALVSEYTRIVNEQACFVSNTFISNARLKLAKNQANAKQHPEAKLLSLENYSHSSSRYHPKIIGHILKNKQKNKCACIYTINHNENEDENSSSFSL